MTLKVDIGGGTIPAPGFTNLDPVHGEGNFKRSIADGIPVNDNTLTHARASHVMEHIYPGSQRGERIWVMNEVHRALRSGGTFEIIVPGMYGTWHPIADPTHVSFWVLESFHYFDGHFAANAQYDIALWKTLELERRGEDPASGTPAWELRWVGQKP